MGRLFRGGLPGLTWFCETGAPAEGPGVKTEHRDDRVYKYMRIYLCNTLYWLVVVGY